MQDGEQYRGQEWRWVLLWLLVTSLGTWCLCREIGRQKERKDDGAGSQDRGRVVTKRDTREVSGTTLFLDLVAGYKGVFHFTRVCSVCENSSSYTVVCVPFTYISHE
jgi:hypothetical protein